MAAGDSSHFAALRATLLMEWPGMFEVCLFAFCLGAAMRVRPLGHFSWLHHLVLVFLTGFGGGTIVPMFFGRPPALFTNDLVVPLVCLAWYLVHYTPVGHLLQPIGAKAVLVFLFEIYRASSILKVLAQAAQDIKAGPLYPIPLIGPILVGTLSGSMGAFMPLDRGLFFIQSGFPLNLQITFFACCFYHITAHDPHILGAVLRGLPFLNLSNPENLKATVVFFFVSMAFCSLFRGPDFNPFEKLHAFLYLVTGLPHSPATQEKLKLKEAEAAAAAAVAAAAAGQANGSSQHATLSSHHSRSSSLRIPRPLEILKILVPLLAVLASFYKLRVPGTYKTRLDVNEALHFGDYVVACVPMQRDCVQHYLTIDPHDGQLSLFRGRSPTDSRSERVWVGRHKRRTSDALAVPNFYAELDPKGSFTLRHQDCNKTYWSTGKVDRSVGDEDSGTQEPVTLRVLDRGAWGVFEGDEALWLSDSRSKLISWVPGVN